MREWEVVLKVTDTPSKKKADREDYLDVKEISEVINQMIDCPAGIDVQVAEVRFERET